MNAWGIVAVIVAVVVLAVVLRTALRGKEDRAARRELRRLRSKERTPDLHGAAEQRRNMLMDHIPGRDTLPGGS
jgi:hypothetical protein